MKEIISNIKKDNIYVVLDFDRTITTAESNDSWAVTGKLLGKELEREMNQLYQTYRPIELDYSIPVSEKEKAMEVWYETCMELYLKYGLTQSKIKESVQKSNLIYRKGAKEFLQKTCQEKIPIIIVSAGIGNIIKEFLKQTNCYSDNIYIVANFLEFDKKGNMKKFDSTKIIHSLNKTMKGKVSREFQQKLKNKIYKILVGDLIEDENMVEKQEWNTTLKIGMIDNPKEKNIALYQQTFDLVLIGEEANFTKVKNIIRSLS